MKKFKRKIVNLKTGRLNVVTLTFEHLPELGTYPLFFYGKVYNVNVNLLHFSVGDNYGILFYNKFSGKKNNPDKFFVKSQKNVTFCFSSLELFQNYILQSYVQRFLPY